MAVNSLFSAPASAAMPIPRENTVAMAKMIRDSFAVVESKTEEFSQYFYGALFVLAPETRAMFPINMAAQRSRLLHALVYIVQMVDRPDELTPFLRQLGRDHRKFDVVAEHYDAVGGALLTALKRFLKDQWTPDVEHAWTTAYGLIARTMGDAAAAETGPAWWAATVLEHHKLARDIAVVRVQSEQPVPYLPGNHLSIEVPQRPRLWRYLSPTSPPREDGCLEFHVRAVEGGWVSRAIVNHTRPGDVWRLGPALGSLGIRQPTTRDLLLIAGGTGLAPFRAIVEDLTGWAHRPRVDLYFGGRTADDLYGLEQLCMLAAVHPWLTVTPVTEVGQVAGGEQGTLADVVTRYGAWPGRDVLVSGSPAMIQATVSRMLVAGTALEQIKYDPFTID